MSQKKQSPNKSVPASDQTIPASDVTRLVRSVLILTAATAIAICSAMVSIYAAVGKKTVAIAVDSRGVVVPIVPLTDPLVSESRVLGFVEECLRKSFSHDFLHYDQTIPQAQECFTPDTADKYAVSLQPFVKMMNEKRMVMAITIPRPPRVVSVYMKRTAAGDVAHWDIQAQVEIFFEGKNERIPPSKNIVKITVKRVPLEDTPRGILIDKFSVGTMG